MAGSSPEEAVDAFLERLRTTLACVVRGTAIGSGNDLDTTHAVTLFVEGQAGGDPARIRTHGGGGELCFRFAHQYRVLHFPEDVERGPYKVSSLYYRYDILDREENEVVVFHWEPEGQGGVKTPHLHVPAAVPVVLPQRSGSRVEGQETDLGRLHLPCGRTLIEDVIELLIRDFRAVPLRGDWEAVVAENRGAFQRGRTW